MDVGDPSNRPRLEALFGHDLAAMRAAVKGTTLDDARTQRVMKDVADRTGYVMCPHTAVGYAGLMAHRNPASPGVVLATAHPAKFGEVVERATGLSPEIPAHLAECLDKAKEATVIPPTYDALKAYLLA
jgi:threonine synthase